MIKPELPSLIREQRRRGKKVETVDIVFDDKFGPQNAFVTDPNRFIAAQCGRRSGKTSGLALRYVLTNDQVFIN